VFSRRAHWSAPPNRLSIARAQHRGALLDLTNSNPTKAGLPYPLDELSEAMARAARAPYEPEPLGLPVARDAIAQHLGCPYDEVAITASTSEAYSFLFKLLCDPGDAVATPVPSYPLLEHLAALELIALRHFPMEWHGRWELDAARVPPGAKALIVVNPNNPTGSYVREPLDLGIPIISDEVFHEYAFDDDPSPRPRGEGGRRPGEGRHSSRMSIGDFTLGGLSKSCGLPHYKLGWIRVRDSRAMQALELIADNFLSVSTPVQAALPDLLRLGAQIREAIRARTRASLGVLRDVLVDKPHAQLLEPEGGWTAVIRVPATMTDEDFAIDALERHGVLVQPGYFFDFDRDGYFVVSLLTDPEILREGIKRIT
jgi:aspartate/methionine/tyrosine aminotransferase